MGTIPPPSVKINPGPPPSVQLKREPPPSVQLIAPSVQLDPPSVQVDTGPHSAFLQPNPKRPKKRKQMDINILAFHQASHLNTRDPSDPFSSPKKRKMYAAKVKPSLKTTMKSSRRNNKRRKIFSDPESCNNSQK